MLNMKSIWNIEFKKLLHRKDVWIMLSMCAIPALYSVGVFFNSSVIVFNGTEKEYAFSFFVNMFHFVSMIFIYFFIMSLIATRTLGGEIENKSILLYTQRINSRRKIYMAKVWALYSVVGVISIVFFIVSMLMFYIFAIHRDDLISSEFFRSQELLGLLLWFISMVLIYLFTISFSTMLSVFLKTNTAVIIFSIVFIAFNFISKFPIIKYLSFAYYNERFSNIDLSDNAKTLTLFLANLLIIFIYSFFINYIGIKKFERRDL
ncbi:ABC transporter permease [Neobacillus notoginsengisoli]|uniref:ABC transporter permease n=1 Tax=Neobacillus notoginsengisoli TaxID=1578198 RepID=A0A417Z038_9BACI|nr:ABC transporter permease [Neobacillus notoginsengisoli]RHW43308.1 ABC transporter permease [Neobacillus notoginsengisoli]